MKTKILIVEDNDDCRKILAFYLRHMGYQTIEAHNGERAIACARAEQPSIILMDLGLPDMDGTQAAALIKQNPDTAHIPIVALTAWTTLAWKEKALQAGITKYLVKPTSPLRLREAIEQCTERKAPSSLVNADA